MTKTIEFICAGNVDRSKTAEAEARFLLKKNGLSKDFRVTSSGTRVKDLSEGNFPDEAILGFLPLYERGGDNPYVFQEYRKVCETKDTAQIIPVRKRIIDFMNCRNLRERGNVFERYGLTGLVDETSRQTVYRGDVDAIFPVDENSLRFVKGIYKNKPSQPLIAPLYAYGLSPKETPREISFDSSTDNIWGEYNLLLERVIEHTQRVIEKFTDQPLS